MYARACARPVISYSHYRSTRLIAVNYVKSGFRIRHRKLLSTTIDKPLTSHPA